MLGIIDYGDVNQAVRAAKLRDKRVRSKLLQGKIEGGPGLAIGVALTVLGVVLLLAG